MCKIFPDFSSLFDALWPQRIQNAPKIEPKSIQDRLKLDVRSRVPFYSIFQSVFITNRSNIVLPAFSFPGRICDPISLNFSSILAPKMHENQFQNALKIWLIFALIFQWVLDRFWLPFTSHLDLQHGTLGSHFGSAKRQDRPK